MKVLLDACVLYPTVMREMLLGTAEAGLFTPLWSARILEEWVRAAARIDPAQEAVARGEVALLRARWPGAEVVAHAADLSRLWLPDPGDIHVLAAAIAGSADGIVTENRADFPAHPLGEEGLWRQPADLFLLGCLQRDPRATGAVAERVLARARMLSGREWSMRALMKKARLPRLGKALEASAAP